MRNRATNSSRRSLGPGFSRQMACMRYLRTPVAASALLFLACVAEGSPVSQPVTFRELFGMEQAESAATVGVDAARCLADALEDFNLVLAAKTPVHATTDDFSIATDGGTRAWRHACYQLTVLKSLTSLYLADGTMLHGYIEGPSLTLKLGPKGGWQPFPIARTKFTFLQREAANPSQEQAHDK